MPPADLKRRTSGPIDPFHHFLEVGDGSTQPEMLQSTISSLGLPTDRRASVVEQPRAATPLTDLKSRRFSRMRMRHASDPQLSTRYKAFAEQQHVPPLPPSPNAAPAPVVSYTSPKREKVDEPTTGFGPLWFRQRSFRAKSNGNSPGPSLQTNPAPAVSRKSISDRIFGERSPRPSLTPNEGGTYSGGERSRSSLALPFPRFSGSSTSDEALYAATTTAFSNTSTTTTFFKIPRRKKSKHSLFPLPAHLHPTYQVPNTSNAPQSAPSLSPSRSPPKSPGQPSPSHSPVDPEQSRLIVQPFFTDDVPVLHIPTPNARLAVPSTSNATPNMVRCNSTSSVPTSSPMGISQGLHLRKRSGTFDVSLVRPDEDVAPSLPPPPSGRASVASGNLGRNSIGGLRALTSRLRHPSESQSPRTDSPGGSNSFQSEYSGRGKETVILPEREEGETAGKYYSRLDTHVSKRRLAVVLSKSADSFNHDVLRSLMRSFKFYEVPLDIAIRQLLWEVELPGEAQQIDRVISAFAERYHECNPHIFHNFDQVYLVAYSLIILHSDLFNKNNKRKMQKVEYQKNTGGHGIDDEILGYFYDNIQYTEFIAQEPHEVELDTRLKARNRQSRVPNSRTTSIDTVKSLKSDPYDYIVDAKAELERLRPSLQNVVNLEDSYSMFGTAETVDIRQLRQVCARHGTLEIVSARSRPDAFAEDFTIQNPQQASPGLVAIRVIKIGLVWRKDVKRRKTQRSWQQWGALLTASQLYFFRNHSWARGLMTQFESHQKTGNKPLIFKPPLEEFKPDFSIPIPGIVALLDSSYDKHKNAFVLARQDELPYEEVLLADNEVELNDWLAKVNYAAAFCWDNISEPDNIRQVERSGRSKAMSSRLAVVEQKYSVAKEKLEENLRNARHLQILVPFLSKTRSDLLSYGARIGLRVRWSRYATWRLQCEHFMLSKGLDIETALVPTKSSNNPIVVSSRTSSRPGPLSRWNSKASALVNPQKSRAGKAPMPAVPNGLTLNRAKELDGEGSANNSRPTTSSNVLNSDLHAFAKPHALTTSGITSEAPTISLDTTSEHLSDMLFNAEMDMMWHKGYGQLTPVARVMSAGDPYLSSDSGAEPETSPVDTPVFDQYTDLSRTPGAVVRSLEFSTLSSNIPGLPDSRQTRRSMPHTLRDSRELHGLHHHRGLKGKETTSSSPGHETKAIPGTERITRGTGSFIVHGKKASIVTLSPEWQHLSAEERLKSRRDTIGEELRPSSTGRRDLEDASIGLARSSSAEIGSDRTSYHSVLEDLPSNMTSLSSDFIHLEYPGPLSPMPPTTHIDPVAIMHDSATGQGPLNLVDGSSSFGNIQMPIPERLTTSRRSYGAALRTFLEDGSTTDEESHDLNEQVGIALGEP